MKNDDMLLLTRTADQMGSALGENVIVLHINHCMENSFEFSRILSKVFKKVLFIGAPYNDRKVPVEDSFDGYYAQPSEKGHSLYRRDKKLCDVEGSFVEVVRALIEKSVEIDIYPFIENGGKLLVIEDGGYHYQMFRDISDKYPLLMSNTIGAIEQTTSGTVRGYHIGRERNYLYPHLSVARSDIKMNVESHFIAERVIEELSGFLYGINTFMDFHKVLLIGYGVIGRRIAQVMSERPVKLMVCEKNEDILKIAEGDGHRSFKETDPTCFDADTIIIGNTGCASFNEKMLTDFAKGKAHKLFLASSSSQDEEFWNFLCMIRGDKPFPDGITLKGHKEFYGVDEYELSCMVDGQEKIKKICLIAKGLPVNFFRPDVISLTNCMIDLIFTEILMLAKWVCENQDAERRLYLLGRSKEISEYCSEEKLFRDWLEIYGFSYEEDMARLMDAHPLGEKLRAHMLFED